jgi:hypothetical protein
MHFKQCLGTCFLVTVGMCWKRIGNFPRMGELTGNALKTLWGMSWELIRNRWDAFECFLHFIHYRILLIYYIIYCTPHIPAVYNSPWMGNVVVKLVIQHSAFILCIRLSLDNPYGTIIS